MYTSQYFYTCKNYFMNFKNAVQSSEKKKFTSAKNQQRSRDKGETQGNA